MTENPIDDRLGEMLADLGENLLLAEIDTDAVIAAASAHPTAAIAPRLRVTAAAAAIVALVAGAILAVAPARSAVADWLGIGRTAIEVDDSPPESAPPSLPTAPPNSAAPSPGDVRAALAAALPFVPRLPSDTLAGSISAWEARTDPVAEMIVVYEEFVVGARPTDSSTPLARKIVPVEGAVTEAFTPDGHQALWVEGDHVRQIEELAATSRSALLWVDGGVEWRLEGDLELDEALALSGSFS